MTKKIKDDKRFFLVDVYYLEMLTAVSTLKRCEDRLSDMGTRMDITNIKIAEIRGGGSKMADDTLREIENEMRELKPDMDISYLDYSENTGDSEIADRLWHIFKAQKNRWNELVEKRNELLK